MNRPENLISFIGKMETLTQTIIQIKGLAVLNFTADWCGTCRPVNQRIAVLAEQHPDVRFIKIHVDLNKEVAGEFGVRAIPHVLIARGTTGDGKVNVVQTLSGQKIKSLAEVINNYK